jgi:outer membrane protein
MYCVKRGQVLKILIICVLLSIFLSSFSVFAGSSDMKIGYINSQRILEESKVGKEALSKLEKLEKEKNEQLTQKKKEIDDLEGQLRKKEFAITPENKKDLEDSIRHKGLELKFYEEAKDKEIKETYVKTLKKIEGQVLDIVLKIGQEDGYDLILGREESGILYANPKQDLTDKVIQLYDRQTQQQ